MKKILSEISLKEKVLYLIFFYLFFSPFMPLFEIGPDVIDTPISTPFENLIIINTSVLSLITGFIFLPFSFCFLLIFQKFQFHHKILIRILYSIFLPAIISVILLSLIGTIYSRSKFSIFLFGLEEYQLLFGDLKYQPIWELLDNILGNIEAAFFFSLTKLLVFIFPFTICLYIYMKSFKLKIAPIQISFSVLKSLPVFYIGIPCEIGDRILNSFFIGDTVYSSLFILWILILVKNLYFFCQNNHLQLIKSIRNTLITLTVLYFVVSLINLINQPPFERKFDSETIIFHRFFLLLPIGCIFTCLWNQFECFFKKIGQITFRG